MDTTMNLVATIIMPNIPRVMLFPPRGFTVTSSPRRCLTCSRASRCSGDVRQFSVCKFFVPKCFGLFVLKVLILLLLLSSFIYGSLHFTSTSSVRYLHQE